MKFERPIDKFLKFHAKLFSDVRLSYEAKHKYVEIILETMREK